MRSQRRLVRNRNRRNQGLGDAPPTPSQAVWILAQTDAAYAIAVAKVGLNPEVIAAEIVNGIVPDSISTGGTTAMGRLADMSRQLAALHTTWLWWAYNGQRDDGTAYTWTQWASAAKDIADAAAYQAGVSFDSSQFIAIGSTILQTMKDVGNKLTKLEQGAEDIGELPDWVLALAAIGGLGLAAKIFL